MIRPERAVGAGARAPSRRPRTIRWLTAMLATLIAVAGLVIIPAPQAGAANVPSPVPVQQACHLFGQATVIITITVVDEHSTQTQSRGIVAPQTIERGTSAQIRVPQPFHIVPNQLDGNTINHLHSIEEVFRVSDELKVTGVSLGTNGNITNGTATANGQTVRAFFPGNYVPQVLHQPPDLIIDVEALETVGTVGTVEFVSNRWSVHATGTFLGISVNVPDIRMTCVPDPSAPPGNAVLAEITTVPGPYQPNPMEPVTSSTVPAVCSFNFNGTASNNNQLNIPFTVNNPGISQGDVGVATIQPGPFNWQGTVNGLTASNRRVQNVRNIAFQIDTPGYDVIDVSAGSASVSYDAGTGVISYLNPPQGNGTMTPPAISVTLEATGATGSLDVVGHSFDYHTETSGLFGSWGSGTWRNTVCSVSSTTIGAEFLSLPEAADLALTVDNISSLDIDVLGAGTPGSFPSDPASVYVFDGPQHGSISLNPATGVLTYTPVHGILETSDSFKYLYNDVEGWASNVATVNITIVGLYCVAGQPGVTAEGCALDQFIEFDVEGDPLTLAQDSNSVQLDTITLDGDPQPTSGLLNDLTVTNQRGDGQQWSVTGQVTDFKEDAESPNCPASVPASWYYKCIPGDNLGWTPLAAVDHDQVPGDVATVTSGSDITSGLSSNAQTLCHSIATKSGGTFECGAVLTLITPASAAAQVYKATLTLTLA